MKAGDTLYIPLPGTSLDSHNWIVISDPEIDPEHVVIVNMTSWEDYKDQACILNVGDHPRVTHRTCINYEMAKVVKLSDLQTLLKKSANFLHGAPVSAALLTRIRNCIPESKMTLGVVDILVSQGVIEEP